MPSLEDDLRAAVAADRELGDAYEVAVVRALAERLDSEIDRRVDERIRAGRRRDLDWSVLLLALGSISLALGVPSATHDHFGAVGSFALTLIAWAAIAAINVAYVRSRRR
jgi:hypothetical protein